MSGAAEGRVGKKSIIVPGRNKIIMHRVLWGTSYGSTENARPFIPPWRKANPLFFRCSIIASCCGVGAWFSVCCGPIGVSFCLSVLRRRTCINYPPLLPLFDQMVRRCFAFHVRHGLLYCGRISSTGRGCELIHTESC